MYRVDWERSVREIKALLFGTRDLSRLNGDLFNLYLFRQSLFISADSPDLSVSGDLSRTRTGSDPAGICEDRKV